MERPILFFSESFDELLDDRSVTSLTKETAVIKDVYVQRDTGRETRRRKRQRTVDDKVYGLALEIECRDSKIMTLHLYGKHQAAKIAEIYGTNELEKLKYSRVKAYRNSKAVIAIELI